jgi:hypothetical protein
MPSLPVIEVAILIFFGIILTVSISWTHFVGAPWVPTSMRMVHKMLTMAEVGPDDLVYDLGCGDGRLVVTAARKYGARAVGIEIDPLRYIWCQFLITVLFLRKRVTILYGNFFNHDLSDANVITCYLLPGTNRKLEDKLVKELDSVTRIISNSFIFTEFHRVRTDGDAMLYLYYPEQTS